MKACIKCGNFLRNQYGKCVNCVKIRQARWYEENKKRLLKERAERYLANISKERALMAKWSEANKDKVRENNKKWKLDNKERVLVHGRVYYHNRHARKNGKRISVNIAETLFQLQSGKCPVCRQPLTKYHLDHKMPLALGGSNTDDNIQLLCPPCNLEKSAKHPIDFMQSKGYLL
jgi:DNA repair exonuclease SbcCD ATPase subunit